MKIFDLFHLKHKNVIIMQCLPLSFNNLLFIPGFITMATTVNICENSSTSTENSELNCPVCLEIPKKEIYLCSKGHSICGSCIETVKRCPACRTKLSGSLTNRSRNFMAEALLDKMKFECPWKDFGCEDLISRDQFCNHEETCKFR